MKKGLLIGLAGFVLLLILFVGLLVGKYNQMVTSENAVANQQAQVEVVLQRRFDLIPNLVESVKGVMQQEQTIFGDIAEARTKYGAAAAGTQGKLDAANELEGSLSRLLVVMENYPDLKSNETVQGLMDELAGSENRISVERQRYNEAVTDFNTLIRVFPNNLLAGIFGFEKKDLFEAAEGADTVPTVDLTD